MGLFLPWGELHELVSNPEYPYFERKNDGLRGAERFFGHKVMIVRLRPDLSEVGYG